MNSANQKYTPLHVLLPLVASLMPFVSGFTTNFHVTFVSHSIPQPLPFNQKTTIPTTAKRRHQFACFMSLKPAALPMMDSGKALARSGELLVDLTTELGLYGGALSAAGAQIRNAGDAVAQAAASCRFKTGAELVTDELREGATCLAEVVGKMTQAVEEAEQDQDKHLQTEIASAIRHVEVCSKSLEAAGAGIMKKLPVSDIGVNLVACGESMKLLSASIQALAPDTKEAKESSQRMMFAADQMIVAGNELQGKSEKPKGKAWLKG